MFSVLPVLLLLPIIAPENLAGQSRDLRSERVVLDDNGDDGTTNTITIQTPAGLAQDVILTIPDPGAGTAEVMLVGAGGGSGWLLGGNAGTIPGTDFLGTTDAQGLHLYVNGGVDNSLVLNMNGSLQREAGGNLRGDYAVDLQLFRGSANEVASGEGAVIGGGRENMSTGILATIVGGARSVASGNFSSIGGGAGHIASNTYATVGGGRENEASGENSTIAGGIFNEADALYSSITGGLSNRASATSSSIGGGFQNHISVDGDRGTIGGGEWSLVSETFGTVAGGYRDTASGTAAAVGGGQSNAATESYATVAGGFFNHARAIGATVSGGTGNDALGEYSAVVGGRSLTLTSAADRSMGFLSATSLQSMIISEPNVVVFGNADLWLANNDTAASQLRFYESETAPGVFPSGTHYTSFEAGAQSGNINYILPTTLPSSGQVLQASAISGSTVTLAWAADATAAAREGGRESSSIAVAEEESPPTNAALLRLIEQQAEQIAALRREVEALEGGEVDREERVPFEVRRDNE